MRYIAEIANNHCGSVENGKKIIDACSSFDAVKFQYRDLSIIGERSDYGKRFRSSHLSDAERYELVEYARSQDLIPVVTPFDELSVDMCVRHDIPILKVASCSNDDWPLLEKIAETGKPVIISTGGLDWTGIDRLYSFFSHRKADFSLMHCVALYPTPHDKANLGVLQEMKKRYPGVRIGHSGHEENGSAATLAIAAGAEFLERHVTLPEIYENAYSLDARTSSLWIAGCDVTFSMMGTEIRQEDEEDALNTFRRGADGTLPRLAPLEQTSTAKIRDIVHEYEAMFRMAGIPLEGEAELSHHYGIENIRETGAYILTVVNREYCKKLIALLPMQAHPYHRHKKKTETFQVLKGAVTVYTDNSTQYMAEGDLLDVPCGLGHSFMSHNGCIFEEISTHAERGDSYYTDVHIQKMDPMHRKTVLEAE